MDIQAIKQKFDIIGNSPALNRAINIAMQVATTDISVLITGESGVGKERIPQIIHSLSKRKLNTYIAVNCGAIPQGTIDSELFGHIKGSFTSASSDRKGYFEEANNGTIFLDEVAELPLSTQVRLLRVLETGEYMKVGSSKIEKTNVRVIAATNMDFSSLISEGKFREDLYYRLNTIPIHIPPLRERKSDVYLLFRKFASDFAEKYNMPIIKLEEDAIPILENYSWKGNIRQLKNITEQISTIENNRFISADILKGYLVESTISNLPVLAAKNYSADFNTEREILYKILFDLKKDVNDLKILVNNIISTNPISSVQSFNQQEKKIQQPDNNFMYDNYSFADIDKMNNNKINNLSNIDNININKSKINIKTDSDVNYDELVTEEITSLADYEKDIILKALQRNNYKRKATALELGISERTLYRKIKDYSL